MVCDTLVNTQTHTPTWIYITWVEGSSSFVF